VSGFLFAIALFFSWPTYPRLHASFVRSSQPRASHIIGADVVDKANETVSRLLFSLRTSVHSDAECLAAFKDNDPRSKLYRCSLLGLLPSDDVSFDDFFVSAVIYKAACYDFKTLKHLVSGEFPLSKVYGISQEAEDRLRSGFRDCDDQIPYYYYRQAAHFVVEVLAAHSTELSRSPLKPKIQHGFVDKLCAISRKTRNKLPELTVLLGRFNLAVAHFSAAAAPFPGLLAFSLTQDHGGAWEDSSVPPPVHEELPMMDAQDAHLAMEGLGDRIKDLLEIGPIDKQLGLSGLESSDVNSVSDSAPSRAADSTEFVKEAIAKFNGKEARLLGIYNLFSPEYGHKVARHVVDDLCFARCPTNNRLVRVTSRIKGQIFLIASHPIEAVECTSIEDELLRLAGFLLSPIKDLLEEYARKNGKTINPMHIQPPDTGCWAGIGPICGSGFTLHTDMNGFLCDDLCPDQDLIKKSRQLVKAEDVYILTWVFSNAGPERRVTLDVYYPDDSSSDHLIASIPVHGDSSHLQLFNLACAKHKPNMGNCPPGHGYRFTFTIRCTEPFQTDDEMRMRRLEHLQGGVDKSKWVTVDQYKYRSTGEQVERMPGVRMAGVAAGAVDSFPGLGSDVRSSVLRSITAKKRIKLPSDRWPSHSMASGNGDIAQKMRSNVIITIDRRTWELLSSAPFMKEFLKRKLYVIASHIVKVPKKKGVVEAAEGSVENVVLGPLLESAPAAGSTAGSTGESATPDDTAKVLTWPGTVFGAQSLAMHLSIAHKNQNHQIMRTDPEYGSDLCLYLLHRNDVIGIIKNLKWWKDKKRIIEELIRTERLREDDPILDERPPDLWVGNSGGGSTHAGERAAPDFDKPAANRTAPDGYMAGGQKKVAENTALNEVFFRDGSLRIYVTLDPTMPFIQNSGVLPDGVGDEPVSDYLGLFSIFDMKHEPDKPDTVRNELRDLGLSETEMSHSMFRTDRHTKYWCRSLLTLRDFYGDLVEEVSWRPLRVQGGDFGTVTVERSAVVDVVVQTDEGGEVTKKTKLPVQTFLTPTSDYYVSKEALRAEFFESKSYEDYIADGETNEDTTGKLKAGLNLPIASLFVALLHASVANFARMKRRNIYQEDGKQKVGYLAGEEFSKLCVVASVASAHSPMRRYDLSVRFFVRCMRNSLQHRFGISTSQDLADKVRQLGDDATDIVEAVLFGSLILRMTGRSCAIVEWCKHFLAQDAADDNNAGTNADDDDAGTNASAHPTRSIPFLPSTEAREVASFTDFVERTSIQADGTMAPLMTNWTGQGDASSIPPDLKRPLLFCQYMKSTALAMKVVAARFIDILVVRGDSTEENTTNENPRDAAAKVCKDCIEEHLQKERLKGSDFKANQVRR